MGIVWKDRVGGNTGGTNNYADLSNKPAINGQTLQAGNNVIDIPQSISDFDDASDYVKGEDISAVAKTGDYNDLINTPAVMTATEVNTAVQSSRTYIETLINNLHAVATTGSYDDLEDKPIIPQNVSDLADANDYAKKTDIAGSTTKEVVTELPTIGEPNTIYIIQDTTDPTVYNQYIYQDGEWKNIGTTSGDIDLSEYVKDASLATVAKTGSYNDLSDKPIIVTATDLSDILNQAKQYTDDELDNYTGSGNTGDSETIINTAVQSSKTYVDTVIGNLHKVATSGNYNDLEDLPDIITQSDLSGYAQSLDLAPVAFTGSYNSLEDTPVILSTTDLDNILNQAKQYTDDEINYHTEDADGKVAAMVNTSAQSSRTYIDTKIAELNLHTVASTGDYNDLENKPTIPNVDNLANEVEAVRTEYKNYTDNAVSGLATASSYTIVQTAINNLHAVATSGSYNDLTDKPNIASEITKVSQLQNDSGYQTKADVDQAMIDYHANSTRLHYEVIEVEEGQTPTLPATGVENTMYLLPDESQPNVYEKYMWINGKWIDLNSTEEDMSNYVTKSEIASYKHLTDEQELFLNRMILERKDLNQQLGITM